MLKLSPSITIPKHVQKQKGSLAKTMALHVRHDFWYISPTFSAKHDINHALSVNPNPSLLIHGLDHLTEF